MERNPHLLIEGCAIGCYAIGAKITYIYIRGEFLHVQRVLERAVAEAYANGALGGNAFGSGKRIDIVLFRGAGAYICGEETALMNSLEGKRGNPRIKPPFPAAAGLFGMPTTINNVETLAAVPHILNRGAAWYKGLCLSNPKSTCTKLFSVCGHILKPGNYEITLGFPMKDLIYDMAGGMRPGRTLKAVIPGGSSVPIMNREEAESALCDYEGIVEKGSMLGSAGFIVMDDTADIVYEVYRLAKFYAHESCAQCTQCREGTAWTTKILERLLKGQGKPEDLDLLLELSDQMTGKTICVLSDSCAAPIVSGIKKFRGEFDAYLNKSRAPALAAV
jgi:NADH-quinone oxidoreductase subunit F